MTPNPAPPPILITNARVLTLEGPPPPRRGPAMRELNPIAGADVLIENGVIARVGASLQAPPGALAIDARGRVLMPGFVDCHTHACFAGARLDEWEQKLGGATYLELLEGGGGIMSTVRSTRAASRDQLSELLGTRLDRALLEGTTTIEVKSGYGLDSETELKMLSAIHDAASRWAGTLVPTACIGHALDPDADRESFIERTISETLPAVAEAYPGVTIDGYCEQGAWTLSETVRMFEAAISVGCPVRIHADQFNSLGMIPEAIRMGARSVDHLEATTPKDLRQLAESDAFGVMLPCSGFHLDDRYANGRDFIDQGGALAIATNYNPGSSPSLSMPAAIALGVRHNRITPAEGITASTVNPAKLLGFEDRGTITQGARADLVMLSHTDERMLAFEFGGRPIDSVIIGGRALSPGCHDKEEG